MKNSARNQPYFRRSAWLALFCAWLVALVASLGALFIGEVMGQTPCNMCWFQRAFMFPLAVILTVAAYRSDRNVYSYAQALAVTGWVIALYHGLIYFGLISEALQPCGTGTSCTDSAMTLFGSIPIPLLSLTAFTAIILLLLLFQRNAKP